MNVRPTTIIAVIAVLLCGARPVLGQDTQGTQASQDSVAVLVAALSHFPEVIPPPGLRPGALAVDSLQFEPREHMAWDVGVGILFRRVRFTLVKEADGWEVTTTRVLVEGHGQ